MKGSTAGSKKKRKKSDGLTIVWTYHQRFRADIEASATHEMGLLNLNCKQANKITHHKSCDVQRALHVQVELKGHCPVKGGR